MTWSRRIRFMCGQIGMMALARFLFSWNLKYADQTAPSGEVLFEASLVGLAFLVARIFDGVTDPLAGFVSDSWVRRGKKRRTLLWFAVAVPTVGMIIFFAPTHAMSEGTRWLLVFVGLLVFFVGYTFYAIPYWSLTADYAGGDPDERRILSNLLGAGLLIATALVAVGSPLLIDAFGYLTTAVILGLPAVVLMALPYFAEPKGATAAPPHSRPQVPLFKQVGMAFAHRKFLAVLLIFCGSQMAFTVVTGAAPFITERLLGGSGEGDVAKIMAPFLATSIPFFLVTPMLARRLGWEKAVVIASVALGVVYAAAGALGEAWIGTPMVTAMVLFGCAGPMAAVILGLEAEAITGCADEIPHEVTSLYFGVFNFLVKGLNGLAMFLTGLLVSLARQPGWEVTAVRIMPLMAGALLIIAGAGYVLVRRTIPATSAPLR